MVSFLNSYIKISPKYRDRDNSSLRVEAVKRDFVAEGRQQGEVTKSVYGQDAYTAFLHAVHKALPTDAEWFSASNANSAFSLIKNFFKSKCLPFITSE